MAQDIPEATYVPEVEEDARKERERRAVEEGTASWRRRKEELQRQKHREQREVCVVNDYYVNSSTVYVTGLCWPRASLALPISFGVVVGDRMKINTALSYRQQPLFFPFDGISSKARQ